MKTRTKDAMTAMLIVAAAFSAWMIVAGLAGAIERREKNEKNEQERLAVEIEMTRSRYEAEQYMWHKKEREENNSRMDMERSNAAILREMKRANDIADDRRMDALFMKPLMEPTADMSGVERGLRDLRLQQEQAERNRQGDEFQRRIWRNRP